MSQKLYSLMRGEVEGKHRLAMRRNWLSVIVGRLSKSGVLIGGLFLTGIMVLMVVNIVDRLFGHTILGVYELVELSIVVTATFAIVYAAMSQGHVVIKIFTSRFSPRAQAIVNSFNSVTGIVFWGAMAWAGIGLLRERWIVEKTELLNIPFLPFRFVWVLGLFLFCLVLLLDLSKALREGLRK